MIFKIILLSLVASLALNANSADKARSMHPNVVLLLVDDMGYGDIAAHGNPILRPPVLIPCTIKRCTEIC